MTNKKKIFTELGLEIIIAAAVMYENEIILGLTHSDCRYEKEKAITYTKLYDINTDSWGVKFGYITNRGRFVLPQTAWKLADIAGLLDENPQSFTRYSEDYYRICGEYFDLIEAKRIIKENCKKELKDTAEIQVNEKTNNVKTEDSNPKKMLLTRKTK